VVIPKKRRPRKGLEPLLTWHAVPLSVPETVPPLAGALKETVGADCAFKGIAAQSETTASAVGDIFSFMDNPSLSWEWTTRGAFEQNPCHRTHYKANQRLNYKS